MFQLGEYVAHNEAESQIFRYSMQGVARQLAYGVQHLKYFLSRKIDRRSEVHAYFNKAEAVFAFETEKDVPLTRGADHPARRRYEQRTGPGRQDEAGVLQAALGTRLPGAAGGGGLGDRREKLHPSLKQYVEEPAEAAAA